MDSTLLPPDDFLKLISKHLPDMLWAKDLEGRYLYANDAICNNLKKSSIFLYKTKKIKQSIISKEYNVTDFSNVRMNFGDGDCSFA